MRMGIRVWRCAWCRSIMMSLTSPYVTRCGHCHATQRVARRKRALVILSTVAVTTALFVTTLIQSYPFS